MASEQRDGTIYATTPERLLRFSGADARPGLMTEIQRLTLAQIVVDARMAMRETDARRRARLLRRIAQYAADLFDAQSRQPDVGPVGPWDVVIEEVGKKPLLVKLTDHGLSVVEL